jgi:DNA polymerase-3 subunit delta
MDEGTRASRAMEFARPPIFIRRRGAVEAVLNLWPSARLVEARRIVDDTVMMMRLQPALEDAAISDALHRIALIARALKRDAAA